MDFKKLISAKTLAQGEKVSFGWGLSYWEYETMHGIFYPIPINWIVKICREMYFKLRDAPDGLKEKAWKAGYQAGIDDTLKLREEDIENTLIKNIKERERWIK